MTGRRVLYFVLSLSLLSMSGLPGLSGAVLAGAGPTASGRTVAYQSAECLQIAWYAGTMQGLGESIDAEESSGPSTDNMETWTDADYDTAIASYDTILAILDSVTPPASAVAFHQAIRDGVVLFQQALGTMKTAGPFALLAYLEQFDALTKKAGDLALPLEEECGIALYDNDGDGEPEVGPGVATPVTSDDTTLTMATPVILEEPTPSETAPVGLALDGRPIMPIGTTVQTSDAFSLTIVSVDQNAVDAVPDAPPDGYQYVNVEITLGHLRDQTDTFDLVSLVALGPTGALYSAVGNSCGFVDGPLAPGDYTGTMTMTGHVCFVVNSRDISGLALFDQTQSPDVRVYLSLDPATT